MENQHNNLQRVEQANRLWLIRWAGMTSYVYERRWPDDPDDLS